MAEVIPSVSETRRPHALALSNLAMSTSWTYRGGSMAALLDPIRDLGFRWVELNHVEPDLLPGLPRALAERGLAARSIRTPARLPARKIEANWLAAPEDARRARALALARGTVDVAGTWGARAGVITRTDPTDGPRASYWSPEAGDALRFAARRDQAPAHREAHKAARLQNALASLRELGEYAATATSPSASRRRTATHIPSFRSRRRLLRRATKGLPVYYWHNVGHAEKQRCLGLATQESTCAGTRPASRHPPARRGMRPRSRSPWARFDRSASVVRQLPARHASDAGAVVPGSPDDVAGLAVELLGRKDGPTSNE